MHTGSAKRNESVILFRKLNLVASLPSFKNLMLSRKQQTCESCLNASELRHAHTWLTCTVRTAKGLFALTSACKSLPDVRETSGISHYIIVQTKSMPSDTS